MVLQPFLTDLRSRVTDRQIDRQTDGIAIAYSALSMYAVER